MLARLWGKPGTVLAHQGEWTAEVEELVWFKQTNTEFKQHYIIIFRIRATNLNKKHKINDTEIKQVYKIKFPGVIIGSKLWEGTYTFLRDKHGHSFHWVIILKQRTIEIITNHTHQQPTNWLCRTENTQIQEPGWFQNHSIHLHHWKNKEGPHCIQMLPQMQENQHNLREICLLIKLLVRTKERTSVCQQMDLIHDTTVVKKCKHVQDWGNWNAIGQM